MEEEIIKGTWGLLQEAFPPQSVVVIIGLAFVNFISVRTLWKSYQKKEEQLVSVSTKAVEVFEKIEQVYDTNNINDEKLNKVITQLEVIKEKLD